MNRALGDVCELAAGRVVFGGADALAPGPGVASGKAGCPRVGRSVPVLLGPCSAALVVGSLRRTSLCWGEAGGADAVAEGPAPARHRCLRSRGLFQLTAVTARFLFSIPIWLPLDLGAQLWMLPPTPRPRVIPAQPERAQEPHCAERRASSARLVPSGGRTGTNLGSCPAPHPREWLQCWGTDWGGQLCCWECSVPSCWSRTGNKTCFDCYRGPRGCAWLVISPGPGREGAPLVSAGDNSARGASADLASAASGSARCRPGMLLWGVCNKALGHLCGEL